MAELDAVARLFGRPHPVSVSGHALVQLVAWLAVLPVATALRLRLSRWALPTELAGVLLTSSGAWLGHRHHVDRSRRLAHEPARIATAHASLAPFFFALLYLRLALIIWSRLRGDDRPLLKTLRRALEFIVPLLAWSQALAGVYAYAEWGRGADQTAIVSHSIAGTALLLYGLALLVTTQTTVHWLKHPQERQSRFDARALIAVGWTIFYGVGGNIIFDGHENWGPADNVHVGLGAFLVAAGVLTLWLSKHRPRVSDAVPSIALLATGLTILIHREPSLPLFVTHLPFAIDLILASLTRAIELTFGDAVPSSNSPLYGIRDLWLVRPGLLIMAALALCMGTDEPSDFAYHRLHGSSSVWIHGLLLTVILILAASFVVLWTLGLIAIAGRDMGPSAFSPLGPDASDDELAPADDPKAVDG